MCGHEWELFHTFCYDSEGHVSPEATRALAKYLLDKGVKGLYVGGSSGECIYQSVEERKVTLENVMAEVGGKMTIIAHVACNNTADNAFVSSSDNSFGALDNPFNSARYPLMDSFPWSTAFL